MKLAVVGGGPSAFYVASRMLQLLPQQVAPSLRIHLYDRLWAPHGLVRYGVAPDHPENCVHKFEEAASDPRLQFFGNVNIRASPDTPAPFPHAVDLPISSLFSNYSHLLFSSGAPIPRAHEALPSTSPHILPALSLVHWYTAHPSLPAVPDLSQISHVTLIGNGNVAMDIARMLLSPVDALYPHDIPLPVLAALRRSAVKHVSIVARRGPQEAACTAKELRELLTLPNASMRPLDPALFDATAKPSRQQARIMQLMQKGSAQSFGTTPRTWSFDFFRQPAGLDETPGKRPELLLEHTRVDPATGRAAGTGEHSALPTDLVVTSLGFRSEVLSRPAGGPLDVLSGAVAKLGHFDTLPGGRVRGLKSVYASGWAANGAKGVLASTMMDAYAVAATLVGDYNAANATRQPTGEPADADSTSTDGPPEEIMEARKEGRVLGYEEWRRIDEEEKRRGKVLGSEGEKERERMNWEDVQSFLAQRP
ncbi:hypothetical protein BD626DRAFT_394305 [Schizophyllum amplum]|uniref:NADPH:adrenodoxin oxidoreductase, mitochondrial n=1 Tax=Schizophyllum amplum TaxID=97359 RepID=A0A550CUB9_9AGAR|nr:hypothetical protein BD626DRAFT_394305 [Auriculariopsis ampla]